MRTHPDHNERMEAAVRIHCGLLDGLLGAEHAKHQPLDLDILGCIYEAIGTTSERIMLEQLVERCREARDKRCYTVVDVASKLKISPAAVAHLARSGHLQGSKVGGQWRFTERAIARFVASHSYRGGTRVEPPS